MNFLLIIFWVQKPIRNREAKVLSLAISGGLATDSHSLALSHYWPTQGLLAAEFPPWPITPRLSQPDPPWLPKEVHVDADLSADAGSTWTNGHQWSPLQAIQQNLPPSSWITRACQCSRRGFNAINTEQIKQKHSFLFQMRKLFLQNICHIYNGQTWFQHMRFPTIMFYNFFIQAGLNTDIYRIIFHINLYLLLTNSSLFFMDTHLY